MTFTWTIAQGDQVGPVKFLLVTIWKVIWVDVMHFQLILFGIATGFTEWMISQEILTDPRPPW